MIRKKQLVTGETYHICSKSIAGFKIFNIEEDFERMRQLVKYYSKNKEIKFSDFIAYKSVLIEGFDNFLEKFSADDPRIVQIIAYCFMPTHIHLVLKQLIDNAISNFMQKVLNGYSTHFNMTHKRKGPLWESRFKSIVVENDEQLNHLVRYLHLNSTTAKLTAKPEDWPFSSYNEYLGKVKDNCKICEFSDILDIKPASYRRFVNDQISNQRELAKIKKLLLE